MANIFYQKTNLFPVGEGRESYVLTIHQGKGDSDLQIAHCLVGHGWLV